MITTRRRRMGNTIAAVALVGSIVGVTCAAMHLATEPLDDCTTTSTSVCSGPPIDHTTNGGIYDSLPPCPTEDSVGCYWNAAEQGNKLGVSVVNLPTETPAPAPESTQVDQPAPITEPAPETAPEPVPVAEWAPRPDDFERATGPVNGYDEGVLFCGVGAAPALDQDEHGNWWAYCEPAMVNEDGTLWERP